MFKNPSVAVRLGYCLVVLGTMLPFGIADRRGWAPLRARGPSLIGAFSQWSVS